MPLYMYQAAYTADSWAAQMKNPQNRVESVGRQVTEAVGGKTTGGWYCLGDYDVILIADVPNIERMAAIAVAVAAGGAVRSSHTTPLMPGAGFVTAPRQSASPGTGSAPASTKRSAFGHPS